MRGRRLLEDARYPRAEPRQHLVGYGSLPLCNLCHTNLSAVLTAPKHYLVTHLHAGDIGNVDDGQVHADGANHRRSAAPYQHLATIRQPPIIAVGVADGYYGERTRPPGYKRLPVAYREFGRYALQLP